MISTNVEFSFVRLCFDKPELWAFKFEPADPMCNFVVESVEGYRKEYGRYPTYKTFIEYIVGTCEKQQLNHILKTLNVTLDEDFVMSKVIKFLEKSNLEQGMRRAGECLRGNDISGAKLALLKGTELVYSTTLDYFKDIREKSTYSSVPTGFKSLDRPMGGGLHKQNLGLFIGPKSAGKSLTMINFGVNATLAAEDVLHISFEDSEEQIASRYDRRYEAISKNVGGNLRIHVFPSGGATVADCEALINVYKPGLVIVDYLNEMGVDKQANRSEALGDAARGLRGAAKRHNCAVWTAQQAGRAAKFSKEAVAAEDGFWSYEPSQVSDIVVTLNQTREEKDEGKIRYIIDRHRNGPDNIVCDFAIDYSKMLLTDTNKFLL